MPNPNVLRIQELDRRDLRSQKCLQQLQNITRASIAAAFRPADVSEEAFIAATGGSLEQFGAGLRNFNTSLGKGARNSNQSYRNQHVGIIVPEGSDEPVGYVASADNASGRWLARQLKFLTGQYVYRAVEFFARPSDPLETQRAVGYLAMHAALVDCPDNRPVTVYSYNTEEPLIRQLKELDLQETGRQPVIILDENTGLESVRMQGSPVDIRNRLADIERPEEDDF